MKIEGYEVTVVRVNRIRWTISIVTPDEVRFGVHLLTPFIITEEAAYDYFKKVPEHFFIDVECIPEIKLLS